MRHTALALALCLSVPAFAQDAKDDAKIKELIGKLDDTDVLTRDEAFQELVKLGAKAAPLLKAAADGSGSAEVKLRASEAIKAIDLAERASKVYREPSRITAAFAETPLAKVLDEVAKQAGVKLEGLATAPDRPITLKLENATLFEALDRICGAQEQLTYDCRGEGVVALAKEKHAATPNAYFGPFRVRVANLSVTRTSDFKSTSMNATLVLGSDYEKYLKPLSKVRYELTKAIDDTGAELQITKSGIDAGAVMGGAGGVVIWGAGMGQQVEELQRTFGLKGFGAGATSLRKVSGTVTYLFPLTQADVKFASPATNDKEEAGEFSFRIMAVRGKVIDFDIARVKGDEAVTQEEMDRRLDADSFVLVDADGKEHKAESVAPANLGGGIVVMGPGGVERKMRYRATFGTRVSQAKELRFRFVDKTLEKAVPFEFKDVRVP